MSDWRRVSLSEVVTRVTTKNVDGTNEKILTVSAKHGLIAQESFFTKKVASKDTSGYYVVAPGQFVYNKSTSRSAAYGTVARNLSDEPGIVSPLYFVFEAKDGAALPEYLELALNSDQFFGSLAGMLREGARAHGLLNVRLNEFYSATVTLPPAPVQERIVEVIGAVDDQIAALDSEASTAWKLLNMMLAEHFATVVGEPHRIVDLCSHVVGGVWGKPAGEDEVDRLALGPRIYTPGTSDFVTDGSPVRSFTIKQATTRTVQEQDIILERSGGSPEQPVGRVAIAGPGLEPCVPTDFQRLIRVDPEKALPRYVFWRLRHDWASGLTRNYSRRTTGITNLSVKDYIAREVPVPSSDEQAGLVERAEAVDALTVILRAEATRLLKVRAGLLSGLLDRTIEIESAE